MAARSRKEINLLKKHRFEDTLAGKIFNWAITAGRVIVIVTELVVIVAFLSRFWLDRTLTDLNDQNAALKAQVEAFSAFESDFRNAQERLIIYQTLTLNQLKYSLTIKEISSLLPADVALTTLSISNDSIEIKGRALSENGIAGLLRSLENTETLKDVKLSSLSLETREQQFITFSLTGSPKK